MAILIWWLPPIIVTAIAVAWVVWSARRERENRVSLAPGNSQLSEVQLRRIARVLGSQNSPEFQRSRTDDSA
ncbi:MAG: hypothetical protein Q8P61_06710 [Candidatus Nanopelagicales bacterium]|nr:hypothetical protein [Candidatus Nanopelagicales bacterium]